MLLPIHSERFHTAPPLNGNGSHESGDRPVRTVDCVTAVLLFAAAVLLTLLAFSVDWTATLPDAKPQAYENTPVMVIPPHPR
ncbi:hypothetical protein ABMY26_22015 [Azospirillum sp. HJ39]|uniref:hypothetical protein n=1 Tax=Azospirillum sp. HJ39 TaxID=3159496 RepID=UPI003558061D